jgi:hypothetical protein
MRHSDPEDEDAHGETPLADRAMMAAFVVFFVFPWCVGVLRLAGGI